jgi:hypothetical protein
MQSMKKIIKTSASRTSVSKLRHRLCAVGIIVQQLGI